jgi:ribosome biogenesis protein UTP30
MRFTVKVTKAVKALQKHVKIIAQKRQQTEILPDEVTHFYVTFTLKHLKENVSQGNFGQKPMAVQLPHSLLVAGDEVCLITKDPQQDFKDLLAKHGITSVNKVIGIKKLRDRFKTYESRRDLAQLYQVFLADDRILPLLPKLLGKQFYEKKKLPLPVRLTRKDLKAEIEKALSSTMYFETSGTCT